MNEWPTDAPVVKCPNGHPITYWSSFIVGKPPRVDWYVRLSPRWVRDGDGWRKGKHIRRWRRVRMPAGRQQDELPDGFVWHEDGIHAPPPVTLKCPRCDVATIARAPHADAV